MVWPPALETAEAADVDVRSDRPALAGAVRRTRRCASPCGAPAERSWCTRRPASWATGPRSRRASPSSASTTCTPRSPGSPGFDIPYPTTDARGAPPAERRPPPGRDRAAAMGRHGGAPRCLTSHCRISARGSPRRALSSGWWTVGDTIVVDQPVVEVETAKARVEVPAPFAGVIARLHAAVGDTVPGRHGVAEHRGGAGAEPPFAEPGVANTAPADESGRVLVGYGTSTPSRRHRRSRATAPAPTTQTTPEPAKPAANERQPAGDLAARPQAGPANTTSTSPSCPAAARTAPSCGATSRPALTDRANPGRPPTTPEVARSGGEAACRSPGSARRPPSCSPARAARSPRPRSGSTSTPPRCSPPAPPSNAARPDEPVSLLALVARFAVLGLRRYPELNARIAADAVVLLDEVHLGFAAQTDHGLVVPVVKNADTMTTRRLAGAIGAHTADARSGAIGPGLPTGRNVHGEQLRRLRGRRLGRDHQPPGGGHPGHRAHHRPALGRRRAARRSQGWPS